MFITNKRIELNQKLLSIVPNVYFQPPPNFMLKYPAIIYSLSSVKTVNANNNKYILDRSYELTLITNDPDNKMIDDILSLPKCSFDRIFKNDNMYHYIFTLFY